MGRQARRIYRDLTDEEQRQLEEDRRLIAEELPDLIRQGQALKKASEEDSLSGELRRAIHRSDFTLDQIADKCGITVVMLDEFLTGEGTLQSDVLDRLTKLLGLTLTAAAAASREAT